MKTRLFLPLLAVSTLSGCMTPASAPTASEGVLIAAEIATAPAPDRLKITAAVAVEVGARFHCPRLAWELELLRSARLSFDLFVRSSVAPESAAIVDRNRLAADGACGLTP